MAGRSVEEDTGDVSKFKAIIVQNMLELDGWIIVMLTLVPGAVLVCTICSFVWWWLPAHGKANANNG